MVEVRRRMRAVGRRMVRVVRRNWNWRGYARQIPVCSALSTLHYNLVVAVPQHYSVLGVSLKPMIKKRTRPQTRVRDPSLDPSDSAPPDSQQEKSEQNQDEGDLPYAFVHSAI